MQNAPHILILAAMLALPVLGWAEDARKPLIESVTPSVVSAGGADFIVRVRGEGFTPATVVRWNGADRVTAVVAPDTLTAMILSSDIERQGEGRLSVFDPAEGDSAPIAVSVRGGLPEGGASSRALNPKPVVEAFIPAAVVKREKSMTLKVRGYGFTPLSVVRWRGAPRHTRFVSSMTLSAELLPEDLAVAGMFAVSVRNPLPGGGVSLPRLFRVAASELAWLDKPRVYPNPWRIDVHEGQPVSFDNLSRRSRISIMTISGAAVKTIAASEGWGAWDLTNQSGDLVAAGAYVYLITDGKRTVEGKLRISR